MKLTTSTVTKLHLSELDCLDPISIIIENYEPGKGRIIVECFGQSWSAYWGGMSGRSVEQFFVDCTPDYLIGCMNNIAEFVDDDDAIQAMICRAVLRARRKEDIKKSEAREIWDNSGEGKVMLSQGLSSVDFDVSEVLFECPCYQIYLPQKQNPAYIYLTRIVQAVQSGLKEYLALTEQK